nr:RHS repeat-associated core domain-containing protein [Moorena sp. SIOASIH]
MSYEEYFPYGGTSFVAGRSLAEVKLKQYRYSGKERDASTGLYYYGARYYAPWLGRWMSCDPAGTVDGLNLYVFVGGNPVILRDTGGLVITPVIGVAYRRDAQGAGHQRDLELVQQANPNARVVTIASDAFFNNHGNQTHLGPNGRVANIKGVDSIFIPGGPHAHPAQKGDRNQPRPNAVQYANARHQFESGLIQQALASNIPILAVCGGSWRLAAELGAQIQQLPNQVMGRHNLPMNSVNKYAHNVNIRRGSQLEQVANGNQFSYRARDFALNNGSLTIAANSVHWAQATFPGNVARTAVEPNVTGPNIPNAQRVTEGFESHQHHYAIGVQWHPEYAQNNLDAQQDQLRNHSHYHLNIMGSIGQAGIEGRAARMIQRSYRTYRNRMREQKQGNKAGGVN